MIKKLNIINFFIRVSCFPYFMGYNRDIAGEKEVPAEKGGFKMPEEFKPGCQRPPIKKAAAPVQEAAAGSETGKESASMIKVGKPAPDFTAAAYVQGKFANVSLSEYKGKWVLLCFYPGDFTFV